MRKDKLLKRELEEALKKISKLEAKAERITKKIEQQKKIKC